MTYLRRSLFVLLLLAQPALSATPMIVRFKLTPEIRDFLRQQEFDVTGVNYKTGEIEALLSEREIGLLKTKKPLIKFSFPQTLAVVPDEEYKNPAEVEDFIQEVSSRYPQLTEAKVIGKSLEGRNIWAIKITGQSAQTAKPVFLVNAMHHAREVMTPEVTTDMVEYLTSNYGKLDEVTRWVDNTEIWVIPMFNVDGNNKMWTMDSMWRKNTRDGHGVDINRNYPTAWNTCNGSSGRKSAQDYRGPYAASEPETQAMMNFVSSIKPVFNISYHSYSEIVIYPFGCSPKRTPTSEAVQTIGEEIGKKLDYKAGTAWELLYNVDGGDIDWMYTVHQVIPYVIEVNSTSQGFHPSYKDWRDKTVLRNRSGWMHLLNKLQGPSLQGRTSTEDFSHIQVIRSGESRVSQTYRINPDGSYFIILKPGMYDFIFQGRKSTRLNRINISGKKTLTL
ncbi:MAG TPA: M14 family metallopeptidase [Bacteriovoracaceae bacterium]|nr:M14 family metallopeptidase [Bacteriovoracaceae bacterium]